MATFSEDLQQIAHGVRALIADAGARPSFAPDDLRRAVLAYPNAGGKAMRPALLTWACEALGGSRPLALRAGTAVELYHTYTLVHDDVIDRDPLRRGNPSVHTLLAAAGREAYALPDAEADHYGLSMAILAGDALQAWAIDLLASCAEHGADPRITLQLVRRLQGVVGPAIVEGEARDIQLPFLPVGEVTERAILRVILTKTAALFTYCAWAGGLLACGCDNDQVRALVSFAEHAGVAFQLQDDVLGLTADESTLGKPVGSDLREGKRTLILALGWERANEDERATLQRVLGHTRATPAELDAATAILHRVAAIADTQAMAKRYLDDALTALEQLPPSEAVEHMRTLALQMVARKK